MGFSLMGGSNWTMSAIGGGTYQRYFGDGYYTAGTPSFPASFQLTDMGQVTAQENRQPYFRMIGTF